MLSRNIHLKKSYEILVVQECNFSYEMFLRLRDRNGYPFWLRVSARNVVGEAKKIAVNSPAPP
jgi:hypothetical protein